MRITHNYSFTYLQFPIDEKKLMQNLKLQTIMIKRAMMMKQKKSKKQNSDNCLELL